MEFKIESTERFVCKICNKETFSKDGLQWHEKTHINSKNEKCKT